MKKKFIAIILARGGSKGIKGKNLIKVHNKPLLYWSLKDCINSKKIFRTWVSSDSTKILNFAYKNKANIIKRPKELAKDNSSSESGWLHAIKEIEKNTEFDYVVAIQATSPIRGYQDLDNAIDFFLKKKLDSLFSSMIVSDHFIWDKKSMKPNYDYKHRQPRQHIQPKYYENGSFFIFNKKKFLEKKNRFFGKIGAFPQKKFKSFQIDDLEDIFIINSIFKNMKKYEK